MKKSKNNQSVLDPKKTLSKLELKRKAEEIKAFEDSPNSELSREEMDIDSTPGINVLDREASTAKGINPIPSNQTREPLRSITIPTASWAEISSGNLPNITADTRLVRPLYYLHNKSIEKITRLAQLEIPNFKNFGLDIMGNQTENPEGSIPSFCGEYADELEMKIANSNGHLLLLAPIYGGGKGQRTEAEAISIINKALAHEQFQSMVVITIGNRGADYLSYTDYVRYQTVLNYSSITKAVQASPFYRNQLVAKETEQLYSRDGTSSFPLTFHFLYRHDTLGADGYITTSNTRTPLYRRLESSESLPQLNPGTERFTAIGGPWRTLNAFGQDLIRKGITVHKTYTSSGDAQLIVETTNLTMKPQQALDLGMWMFPVNEFCLHEGETILGVQKKGCTVPMIIKTNAIKNHARFLQPSGGCRISIVLPSEKVQEFVREATSSGMHVFGTTGRIFATRNYQNDSGYKALPSTVGDIEIPSIPLSIEKAEITNALVTCSNEIEWIAGRGTSPFNYSLLGLTKPSTTVTPELLESIRDALERFGLIAIS